MHANLYKILLSYNNSITATHCLIEWNEPNSPISVVEMKNVVWLQSDREPQIGDSCIVKLRERSKPVEYPGRLLAIGSKKEMELEMSRLDNLDWSDDDGDVSGSGPAGKDTEDQVQEEEQEQPPKKRRRQVVSSI